MARLSLCMIVRDEADVLPRFLSHARGLWDELVAVDTGSADATPRLLAEAGARVLHAEWTGDFAAARNVSLAAATGDWLLVLDADELASPELVRELRALLGADDAGAATLRVVNPLPHGHVRESRLLRAFRRDPSIRYRHAIHEDASESVLALLARSGQRLVALEGPVEHLGYVRARAAAKDKKARDVALLERLLAADPLDLYSHLKLLEQARFWDDAALRARAAADARAAVAAAPERLAREPHAGELLALLADGPPAGALALVDRHRDAVAPSAALHLRRGELLELLGRAPEAAAEFQACLALADRTSDRQLAGVRPRLGLARLALAAGRLDAARAGIADALALAPRDPEALLAALVLEAARGGAAALRGFADAHAARHGASPELAAALGEAALRSGALDLALESLGRAAGDPPAGRAARELAVARLAAGDAAGSRALARALVAADPAAGLVVLLADLAEGRDSDLELDLEPAEADRVLRELAAVLRRAARPDVKAALVRGAPALEPLFPGIAAALR
jgi:hypothetical protein